jgi:hypothetical protein
MISKVTVALGALVLLGPVYAADAPRDCADDACLTPRPPPHRGGGGSVINSMPGLGATDSWAEQSSGQHSAGQPSGQPNQPAPGLQIERALGSGGANSATTR